MLAAFLSLAALTTTVIEPLPGEKWWGGAPIAGEKSALPYATTAKRVDLARSCRRLLKR